MTEPLWQAPPGAVAQVAVDVGLAHLDRFFDYRIPEQLAADAVPGARVVVRFSGQLRDGFIVAVTDRSEHPGTLATLYKVVSAEPVLQPEIVELIRAVADHYAGTFADVLRLAIPPRHAATERAAHAVRTPTVEDPQNWPLAAYPSGTSYLRALTEGHSPRAAWNPVPTSAAIGEWPDGLAQAAAATVASGRSAVLVVPDARDLTRLAAACNDHLGSTGFVQLTAEEGPAARYRAFLAACRGEVPVVIGTRSAAFAPVRNLGLVAIWDDGDDLHTEPRAPYPHARDVLVLRSALSAAGFLAASYARSCELQQFVERGWVHPIAFAPSEVRAQAPVVRAAADTDRALDRDAAAQVARMPHDVFSTIRAGLSRGPVLMQVPRAGYLLALVCQDCRVPIRCPTCGASLQAARIRTLECGQCGYLAANWCCPSCGSCRWRAPVVGAERTADELGRAFPMTVITRSARDHVLADIDGDADLVVATPGAEPRAPVGYAAAVALDGDQLLWRADLRAAEEALRRWLTSVALVRPAADDGTVTVVADPAARAVQALIRLDPAGFAALELNDRRAAGMSPAVVLIAVTGTPTAMAEFTEHFCTHGAGVEHDLLGPVDLNGSEGLRRLLLRCALAERGKLVAAVKAAVATRSAHKEGGGLKVSVDPVVFG